MSTILDLQPASVWHYFHQLTQIPRPSHHEEAVQQYVLDEAARLGLSAERDAVGNIRVRKPASAGHEGAPGVILQGHLDMVPQKNADKVHDFTRDPITTQVHADGRLSPWHDAGGGQWHRGGADSGRAGRQDAGASAAGGALHVVGRDGMVGAKGCRAAG